MEEQEPRACRVEVVLNFGWRCIVAISKDFFLLFRAEFGDLLCTDSSLRPSFEIDTHKLTMSGCAELITSVLFSTLSCLSYLSVHPVCEIVSVVA